MKVVIFAVLLGLVGCGEDDKESVTKAVAAAEASAAAHPITGQDEQGVPVDNPFCPDGSERSEIPAQECGRY